MSISGIGSSTQSFGADALQAKNGESVQQLAAQGDPSAIAKMHQQQEQEQKVLAGPTEAGKGEQVDEYV